MRFYFVDEHRHQVPVARDVDPADESGDVLR